MLRLLQLCSIALGTMVPCSTQDSCSIRASRHQVNEELFRTSLADAVERHSSTPTKASHKGAAHVCDLTLRASNA